jgi:hypothetical protein
MPEPELTQFLHQLRKLMQTTLSQTTPSQTAPTPGRICPICQTKLELAYQLGKLSTQEQIAVKSKLESWLKQGQQVVQTGPQTALSDAFVGKQMEAGLQPLQTTPSQITPSVCRICGYSLERSLTEDPRDQYMA